jgi:endonuclease YncB( thermonuclease family)
LIRARSEVKDRLAVPGLAGRILVLSPPALAPALRFSTDGDDVSDWLYDCVVKDVYDGDTVIVDVDLGFQVWHRGMRIRLFGINAPEMNTDEGKRAKVYLQSLVAAGCVAGFTLESHKDRPDKYGGRWLGRLLSKADGVCLNDLLIEKGFAKGWDGKGEKPV